MSSSKEQDMNKYEAMFIIKPDLGQESMNTLFDRINDVITKNEGKVISSKNMV